MADDDRKPLLEIAPYHRSERDARDYVPPPISIGANSAFTKTSVKIGSFEATIDGAGLHEAPVVALADDLLFYRNQVIELSAGPSLSTIARA